MNNNGLAIIVAFYFAKYDQEGLDNLGFKSFSEAFQKTADFLGVKKNYVKLRRDEFDPVFPWRQGWKRPMDKRIIRTIDLLNDLREEDIRYIVKNILYDPSYRESDEINDMLSIIKHTPNKKQEPGKFILRCPTGKAAEEYFLNYYNLYKIPTLGSLHDCRDLGCGYDYKIVDSVSNEIYVEVKGLSDLTGGILFTNKEWEMAVKHGDNYYLCIVRNINDQAEVQLIKNPAEFLKPVRSVRSSIQINWSVSDKELKSVLFPNKGT